MKIFVGVAGGVVLMTAAVHYVPAPFGFLLGVGACGLWGIVCGMLFFRRAV